MSRADENTRDKFADTGIFVRYKYGYVAWHLTLPHRDLKGAGTSRPFMATPAAGIAGAGMGREGCARQKVVEQIGPASLGPGRSLARSVR
jgi:hypothetical protein